MSSVFRKEEDIEGSQYRDCLTSTEFESANIESRGEHITPRPPRPTSNTLSLHSNLNV